MHSLASLKTIAKMGQGGMAEVFKAEKVGPDGFSKIVALKKILPFYADQDRFIRMLSAEAKLHSYLSHPNIVQILDFFEEQNQYCMVLEFVEGKNLREIFRLCQSSHVRFPWQAGVYVAIETLKALQYAHQCQGHEGPLGIIHRDVSPQNILISYRGEVKLSDFGIAKARLTPDETASGVLKGKYRYLSPEQITEQNLTPASDLFSLGVTLYELLSGRHPFGEFKEFEMVQRIVTGKYIPISKVVELPKAVEDIIAKSVERDPHQRYFTAKEMADDFLEIQDPSWITHGQELFANFLHHLLGKEKEEQTEAASPTLALSSTWKVEANNSGWNRPTKRSLAAGSFVFLFLSFAFFIGFRSLRKATSPLQNVWQTQETYSSLAAPQFTHVVHPTWEPLVWADGNLEHTSALTPSANHTHRLKRQDPSPNLESSRKKTGTLSIQGPVNTQVYLNGKDLGLLPQSALSLRPGNYLVVLSLHSLRQMYDVSISPDQNKAIVWDEK